MELKNKNYFLKKNGKIEYKQKQMNSNVYQIDNLTEKDRFKSL